MNSLLINEIFFSIQGESTWTGLPCAFVRLAGCHLRCGYCDTAYAFHEGRKMSIEQILAEVLALGQGCPLVEITGGEPLLQANLHALMRKLADAGKTVLLETSGACDISPCDPRVIRIMDLKTPGSGEAARNDWNNIAHLRETDEVKFVLCAKEDYRWAVEMIQKHDLGRRVQAVLFSAAAAMPVTKELTGCPGLGLRELAQWMLADTRQGRLPANVRLQTQLHKLIWDPQTRGV